jgi:hypothetical protein
VTRPVNLDEDENFSQLCVVVNIVKVMPGTNLLLSTMTVEDGVIRVFRDWLKEQTKRPGSATTPGGDSDDGESHMLWVGQSKNVGLKVRVREKQYINRHAPVLVHQDEDPFVSYELYIDGKLVSTLLHSFIARIDNFPAELHIRTTRLLMTMEQSLQEEQNYTKAMIFTRSLG